MGRPKRLYPLGRYRLHIRGEIDPAKQYLVQLEYTWNRQDHRRLNIESPYISYADPSSKIATVNDTSRQCLVFVAYGGYSALAVRAFRAV